MDPSCYVVFFSRVLAVDSKPRFVLSLFLGFMASCSMGYVLSLAIDSENTADMSELILLIVSLLTLFIFAFTVSMFVFI